MSKGPEWNPENLPDWVRDALEETLTASAPPSVLNHRTSAAWPLLVEAAVVSAFLPRQLAPEAVTEDGRQEAENAILSFAETTVVVEDDENHPPDDAQKARNTSQIKWMLTRQARTEVLQAALRTTELEQALTSTAERFHDLPSQMLRDCLRRENSDDLPKDLKALEATRVAVASLTGVSGVALPALEELDREIQLRRLLAQFERMVGQRNESAVESQSEDNKEDCFFGRDKEMERLRGYVGVIPADSLAGLAGRALKWVKQTFTRRKPMIVWGVGGVGKTTLISKFMLEHAEAASSRFPFAYLDFDRTTISARQRGGLLAEMCLQTGSQFQELAEPLAELREKILQLARALETTSQSEDSSLLIYTREFRQLIDQHMDALESTFESARPFLLVFDTFEVVQYTEDNIANLEKFVRGFSLPNDDDLWPRLRLIISGRKTVSNFSGPVEEMQLGALDAQGSAQLLMALARNANKQVSPKDAAALVAAVAKATGERGGGVQPLRLRLLGELFKDSPDGSRHESGPTIVQSLLEELSHPLKSDGLIAKALIDGILIRRVVERVNDKRVKALADPGLVVRRITREVIEEVMTRGTPRPGTAATEEGADKEQSKPWIVSGDEAQDIFEAFRKEVGLVEVDGEALRHRPDVRQQMLPLIRARRPQAFLTLHKLAFDYFRRCVERDASDWAAAAEAIYHGLWLDESLSDLDKLWPPSPSFDPRIDSEEFDPGSKADVFVRAKTQWPLTPSEVSLLPREVALEWLDARSKDLLREDRIEEAIETGRIAAGPNYGFLDEHVKTAAIFARLLYRAGHWDDAAQLALRHLTTETNDRRGEARLSLLRTLMTLFAKSGVPEKSPEWVDAEWFATNSIQGEKIIDPVIRLELAAHLFILRNQLPEYQRSAPYSISGISREQWKKDLRILRLAIIVGNKEADDLLEIWMENRERVIRDVGTLFVCHLLFQIFHDLPAELEVKSIMSLFEMRHPGTKELNAGWGMVDMLWRREKSIVLEAVRKRPDLQSAFRWLVAFDHSDWMRPLGNALTRALKQQTDNELGRYLGKAAFWPEQATPTANLDGVAVVQFALDNGRLLDLATYLSSFQATEKSAQQTRYPEDVFELSVALLHWHSTIREYFEPPNLPSAK
jgi:hypothetical protein